MMLTMTERASEVGSIQAENDELVIENEQLKQRIKKLDTRIKRYKTLLKASHDLLKMQKDATVVLDLTCEAVRYDGAECDGYCLMEDIQAVLSDKK